MNLPVSPDMAYVTPAAKGQRDRIFCVHLIYASSVHLASTKARGGKPWRGMNVGMRSVQLNDRAAHASKVCTTIRVQSVYRRRITRTTRRGEIG